MAKDLEEFIFSEKGFPYFIVSLSCASIFFLAALYALDIYHSKKGRSETTVLALESSRQRDGHVENVFQQQHVPAELFMRSTTYERLVESRFIGPDAFYEKTQPKNTADTEKVYTDILKLRYELEMGNILRCIRLNVGEKKEYLLKDSFEIRLDDQSQKDVIVSLGRLSEIGQLLVQYKIISSSELLQINTAKYNLANSKKFSPHEYVQFVELLKTKEQNDLEYSGKKMTENTGL